MPLLQSPLIQVNAWLASIPRRPSGSIIFAHGDEDSLKTAESRIVPPACPAKMRLALDLCVAVLARCGDADSCSADFWNPDRLTVALLVHIAGDFAACIAIERADAEVV